MADQTQYQNPQTQSNSDNQNINNEDIDIFGGDDIFENPDLLEQIKDAPQVDDDITNDTPVEDKKEESVQSNDSQNEELVPDEIIHSDEGIGQDDTDGERGDDDFFESNSTTQGQESGNDDFFDDDIGVDYRTTDVKQDSSLQDTFVSKPEPINFDENEKSDDEYEINDIEPIQDIPEIDTDGDVDTENNIYNFDNENIVEDSHEDTQDKTEINEGNDYVDNIEPVKDIPEVENIDDVKGDNDVNLDDEDFDNDIDLDEEDLDIDNDIENNDIENNPDTNGEEKIDTQPDGDTNIVEDEEFDNIPEISEEQQENEYVQSNAVDVYEPDEEKTILQNKFFELKFETEKIFKLVNKDESKGFDLLGGNDDRQKIMYKLFPNGNKILIEKTELNKETETTETHSLIFDLPDDSLQILIDDELLYDEYADLQNDTNKKMQVSEKLNKFIFLVTQEYKKIAKEKKEKEKTNELKGTFRNF